MKTAHILYFLCTLFVTTHTIAGGDINNEFAITAYDSSIDGTDDMVDGNESWYSIANTVPELPSSVTIEAAPRKSRLNWTPSASSDINKYIIYRGTTTDPTEVLTEVIDPTAVFFVDTDLTQGSNYFYRIKSVSTTGVESDFSQNYSVVIPDSWIVSLTPGPLDQFGSIQNPYNTIQAAIDQSINGDAVVVYPGVYVENVSITEKVVSLTTPDPTSSAETTIIDGGANGYPVLTLNGGFVTQPEVDLILSGFTLRNGLSPTYTVPGGLHVHLWRPGITIKISNLIIEDNIATAGNSAAGSYFYYTPLIEMSDVIYRNNISASHSTFGAFNAPFSMDRCEFYNNTSPYRTLDFWQNEPRGFSTISNSLINNNIGGGSLYGMDAILLNTTIVDNGTQNLFRGNSAIVNTIIGSGQFISSDTGLLKVHNSHLEDGQNSIDIFPSFLTYENNLEGDIYFTDAENLDFTLSEYSPAIGAGLNSITLYGVTYDLSSNTDLNLSDRPLPQETNIDIGAYENSLGTNTHNSNIYVSVNEGSNEGSVGLETQPFQTIQAAINYAIDGDSIYVFPGTYPGGVSIINKGINFISTTPLGAIINNNVNNSYTFTFSSDTDVFYSTITGFDINKTSTDGAYGVRATNEHYVNLYKSKISNFTYATSTGVSAIQAENCLLINNAIAIYNDQCSTGSITPLLKNCTIINSTTIHAACPTISLNVFNSIVLVSDTNQNTYTSAPNFNKVITNDVNVVPQENSTWEVALDGETDIYFTDYTGGDYTLSEFSPALGYGSFPVSEDILGNSRPMPVGSSLDAGAFESSLGSPSNAAPRFGDIADISTNEDSGLHSINIIEIVDGDILSTQDLTFTVSSDNPSLFSLLEISYMQGENNAVLNYDTNLNQNGTANISVTLSDDGNGDPNIVNFVNKGFEISVFPVNDSPTDIFLSNQLLTENTINIPVALLTAEDIDDDAFSYELVPGVGDQNNSSFEIVGTDLRVVSPFDFENTLEAFVRLRVLDSQELTFEKEFVITIQDINDSPVANDQSITLDEDTLASVSLTANDQDNDPLTYTIVNQPTNGTAVLTANTIDYTPIGDYSGLDSFTFTVNDGAIDSNLATVSIDVLPVNDAPTSIEITSSSIVENIIASVGLISCVDPDADDVYAYELVVGSGDTNNNLFEIIGNELYNINPLNFETQELYTVRIKASNVNDEIEEVFPIQVTNVNDINIASQIQDSYCEGSTGDGQITITEINEVSGNVVFDWTGPSGFTSQDQSIINLEPGLYDLEVSDDFFTYSESFSVGLIPIYENLEICYVSGDSNEPTKNRIYLNKEGNYNVGAYKVFRETTIADQYQQIGLVLPTEDSFLDNNSNNLIRQYKYKVTTLDNCGLESGFSEVHYNTFLQANLSSGGNVNLFWEPYFGLNYDSFYIYRSENGSTFEILAVLPSNQTVYNDISADVGSNDYSYYIGIIAEECTLPDPFNGGADTRILPIIVQSNPLVIVDGALGVTQMLYTGEISLYPNPASDQINIVCPEQLEFIKVELYNINGQYLGSNNFKNMSVSQLQGGVYFLKIYTKQGAFIKKIIKK